MSDISLSYEHLKLFFEVTLPHVFEFKGLPPEKHPSVFLAEREAISEKSAMRSLKMAISDLLVPLAKAPTTKLDALSNDLSAAGAPSLAMVRAWASRRTGAIFKRGSIATDDEFEIMKALLDHPQLQAKEREQIQRLIEPYEFGR